MVVVLILVSRLKHAILMLTANFVDVMIIDTDTLSFLLAFIPICAQPADRRLHCRSADDLVLADGSLSHPYQDGGGGRRRLPGLPDAALLRQSDRGA